MGRFDSVSQQPDCVFLEMVFPEQANHYGTLYGSKGLEIMGRAAFIAASRHSRKSVVMAATDKVVFRTPVPVGSLLEFTAAVVRTGRTSMTVAVEATLERMPDGERTPAMTGRFEMVAINADGRPTPLQIEPAKETHS